MQITSKFSNFSRNGLLKKYYICICLYADPFSLNILIMILSLNKVEALISKLSSTKKALLLNHISKELGDIFPGIEKTHNVCGGSACIIRTRIPVWTLVSFKKLGMSNSALLASYPTLRQQDLNNAWAYYKENKKQIDLDIKENDEA